MIADSTNPYQAPQTEVCRESGSRESTQHSLGSPIQITGKLRRDEIEAMLDLHEGHRKPRNRRWRWLAAQIISVAFVISAMALLVQHPTWIPCYLWLGLTLLGLYWAIWKGPRAHRLILDELERQALDREFLIAEQGLMVRSAEESASYEWPAITGFRDSDQQVLIYVGETCIPVCRHWFTTNEEWQRLIIFLGHRVEMLS